MDILSTIGNIALGTSNSSEAYIILSANNAFNNLASGVKGYVSGDLVVLPIVNADLPELATPWNNETFSGLLGDLAIIGTKGLTTFNIEALAPNVRNKYSYQNVLGNTFDEINDFIVTKQQEHIPIRVSIVNGTGDEYINTACTIDNYSYSKDNVGDYHYKIAFRQYPIPLAVTVKGG